MKVFTGLLLVAFVAAAATAPTTDDLVNRGVAKVDQTIDDFQKQIKATVERIQYTSSELQKKLLQEELVEPLSKQVKKLKDIKAKLVNPAADATTLKEAVANVTEAIDDMKNKIDALSQRTYITYNELEKRVLFVVVNFLSEKTEKLNELKKQLETS